MTVVNNFQFLNVDLTTEQIDEAISKSCLCKVNHNDETSIEYELTKSDEISTKCTPFDVAVHLLKNNYGECENLHFQKSEFHELANILMFILFRKCNLRDGGIRVRVGSSGGRSNELVSKESAAIL